MTAMGRGGGAEGRTQRARWSLMEPYGVSLPLASDQFFTLNSLLRTRIRSQAAMWVSYRPDQAWVALLLNIASSISCHKLAGVALARCLSRQVKNDPPTADRTAQLAGWAMGVLGRPIPRAPGAGGRYIGLEWAVASRAGPSQGGTAGGGESQSPISKYSYRFQ